MRGWSQLRVPTEVLMRVHWCETRSVRYTAEATEDGQTSAHSLLFAS